MKVLPVALLCAPLQIQEVGDTGLAMPAKSSEKGVASTIGAARIAVLFDSELKLVIENWPSFSANVRSLFVAICATFGTTPVDHVDLPLQSGPRNKGMNNSRNSHSSSC